MDVTSDHHTIEMYELVHQKNWAATSLGPMSKWPQSLKTTVDLCLASRFPSVVFWGDEHVVIYNDSYRLILGKKHPHVLGVPGRECWPEVWHIIGPMMENVLCKRESIWMENSHFAVERNGYVEEAYFSFSFTPIIGELNKVRGIFNTVVETTKHILTHRRLAALNELANQSSTHTLSHICENVTKVLEKYIYDLPFTLIYLLESDVAVLQSYTKIHSEHNGCLPKFHLDKYDPWCMKKVKQTNQFLMINDLEKRFELFPKDFWNSRTPSAIIMPIPSPDNIPYGFFITGISSQLKLDQAYHDFLQLIVQQLSRSFSIANAYEQEFKKAEKLAQLDHAKTHFFNNVSHEFRTPLTLILGPVQDALSHSDKTLRSEQLETVHRNALRLLRLVNSLLDFARIDSTQVRLNFTPVDLSKFTQDLANTFRFTVEQAGIQFEINCPSISQLIYVDPIYWEKIVLNLLSNAFKFTLHGKIVLTLKEKSESVELIIKDTGCGIPQQEFPYVFQRFHRIESTKGRSFEGSGIGLSLVYESVKIHQGNINFQSTLNEGTTFIISIPKGRSHLAQDAITAHSSLDLSVERAEQYVEEATLWTKIENVVKPNVTKNLQHKEHILIADDNTDMRYYLKKILSMRWQVTEATDGEKALTYALENPPDLILSDIMMPKLDGIELFRKLRADRRTREIPVLFLSARVGEESLIEGIEIGALDYLTKPFSARELIARIQTHLNMSRLRREWAYELEQVNKELEAFSYSVSHDLKAPLRSIEGFSQVLLQEYSKALDNKASTYLQRICMATQRMSLLIEDLLTLSRVSRMPIQRCAVNMTLLAKQIFSEIITSDTERCFELNIEDNLIVQSDPSLLEIMLYNLLSNAWKFTAKQVKTYIKIGKMLRDNKEVFFVKDNGVGFEMTYAKKIFTPFQRFHSDIEFPGTGIGLATVQRIAHKHEGDIWVEAYPNQGAQFFFIL